MRLKSQQDAAAGAVFATIGVFGLVVGRNLTVGDASFMQAGYLPRLVCLMLVGIGALIAARAFLREGPDLESWAWRPLIMLTTTVLAFALLIINAGLVVASAAVVVLSNFAARSLPLLPLAVLTVCVTALSVGIFHFGLSLPIPLWPF